MICTRQTGSAALTVNNRSPSAAPPPSTCLQVPSLMLERATRLRSTGTAGHQDFVVFPPPQSSPHEKQKGGNNNNNNKLKINNIYYYYYLIM
jgi:hypothetical protein